MQNIIVECSKDGQKRKNTGANEQCIEGVTIRHALAPLEQEFATVAAAKTLATWKTDVAAKDVIPLYEIEELAIGDTEAAYFEGNNKYMTKKPKKRRTFNCFLGLCSHDALSSYDGAKMRVYEFTDAQEIKATTPDGIKIRGQVVTVSVGMRVDAMPDKPAYTPVTLEYADYKEFENNGVVLKPTWSQIELNGIFDVTITIVSASATSIKFTVDAGCAGDIVSSLEDTDITLKTALGVAVTHSFVAADSDGIFELTGTGFVAGIQVDLNGIVSQTEAIYESVGPTSITI